MTVTDDMVERAAMALEKDRTACYEWTDEQFDIWWNRDPSFVRNVTAWGNFIGTPKEHLFHEVRIALEGALS